MTRHRHYNLSEVKPTGRCLECGKELTGRRRKYCSDEHANAYFARYDYKGMVREVLKRDNWTCQICSYQNENNKGVTLSLYSREKRGIRRVEVDHIVALADGANPLDQDNCRTLCEECHKKETAEWHRVRALKRRYGAAVREAPRDEAERKEESKQLALF